MPSEVELERLVTRFTGDSSGFEAAANRVAMNSKRLGHQMEREIATGSEFGRTLDGLSVHMSNLVGQMRAMAALESPFAMIKKGIGLAAAREEAETQFGVMLQSANNAKILIKDMIRFAADTPLNFTGIQVVGRQLLQFGVDGQKVIETIRMIGDVAGGNQERLQGLAYQFGQARQAGRLTGEDVRSMTNWGFNPLNEISRTTGKSVPQLRQDVEHGLVTFKMLEAAFKSATSKGGDFFEGMAKGSLTLKGLFSTMKDDIDGFLRTVGEDVVSRFKLKELVKGVSSVAQELTNRFDALSDSTKTIITSIAIVLGSFGSLIIAWKVGRIMLGIFAGTLEDILVTTRILPVVNFLLNISFKEIIGTVRTLTGLNYLLSFSFTKMAHTIKATVVSLISWTIIPAIIIGIVMTITAVIDELGGFQAALEFAKDTGVAIFQWFKGQWAQFVEWIKPVTDALEGLWNTAVTELRQNLVQAFNFVKQKANELVAWVDAKWKEMGLGAIPSWNEIRDAAIRAILFIEFTITHVEQVARTVWAGIKYYALVAFNFIAQNFLLIFLAPIAFGFKWLIDNWAMLWLSLEEIQKEAIQAIGGALERFLREAGRAFREFVLDPTSGIGINWQNILEFGNFDDTIKRVKARFQDIPKWLGTREIENQLKAEFEAIKAVTGEQFEEFYQRRLKELGAIQTAGAPASGSALKWEKVKDEIDNTGAAIKHARHEAEKFDAALSGSAEALFRVTNFRQLTGQNRVSTSLSSNPNISSPQIDYQQQAYQTTYLKDIRNIMIEQAKKRALVVEGAGLNR